MPPEKRSIAQTSLKFSGLFESELLVELMLRYWHHPLADDGDFRMMLLENAALALRASIDGSQLIEGLAPENVNLVAALWYAESVSLNDPESSDEQFSARRAWTDRVRRALPSCFCNSDHLT